MNNVMINWGLTAQGVIVFEFAFDVCSNL